MRDDNRIYFLDGLRGLFAFCVLAFHYVSWSGVPVGGALYSLLDRTSIYAVCGFFVLSGVSMTIAYLDRPPITLDNFLSYIIKRFFRIAPLYYAVLSIHIAAKSASCFTTPQCDLSFSGVASNIFFTFGIGRAAEQSMVVAGWSIGIEWVFYFLFPFMLTIASRSLFSAFMLVIISFLILISWDIRYIYYGFRDWLAYAQFPAYLFYFSVGVLIGLNRRNIENSFMYFLTFSIIYVVSHYIFVPFDPSVSVAGPAAWLFGALTCAMVWAAASSSCPNWARRSFIVAGELSYPVYLTHFPVFMIVSLFDLNSSATLALSSIAVVFVSFLSWNYYERPLIRIGHSVSKRLIRKSDFHQLKQP